MGRWDARAPLGVAPMHEEALLRDLRRRLEELARAENPERITRVSLWVGALAHTSEETLRSRWPATVEGTAAEGSRLDIELSPDVHDPRAGGIVLVRVDVSDRPNASESGAPSTPPTQEGTIPSP